MGDKYTQHEGYDKYRNTNYDGSSANSGKATYDSDGSLRRWDNYSPSSSDSDKHHHEWQEKQSDGSYTYGHGEHDNH